MRPIFASLPRAGPRSGPPGRSSARTIAPTVGHARRSGFPRHRIRATPGGTRRLSRTDADMEPKQDRMTRRRPGNPGRVFVSQFRMRQATCATVCAGCNDPALLAIYGLVKGIGLPNGRFFANTGLGGRLDVKSSKNRSRPSRLARVDAQQKTYRQSPMTAFPGILATPAQIPRSLRAPW